MEDGGKSQLLLKYIYFIMTLALQYPRMYNADKQSNATLMGGVYSRTLQVNNLFCIFEIIIIITLKYP